MAILAFQKPDKVIMTSSTEVEGEFEFKPLEPGYGITIGNALRRILLSSLEGYAISSVKIQGVDHEFATIKGVMEDVTEIVLNLKQVRFKKQIDGTNTEKVSISVSDREVLTAGDLGKFTSAFQVLNPDQVICRMESNVKLKMDITIVKGRGYVPAEENKPLNAEIGMIPIDSIFTPIKNVKYTVENFRVEQKTDYEKLLLNVTTDGSIHPKEALKEAAKILIYHFALFSDEKITIDLDSKSQSEELDENDLRIRQLLKTKLVDMDLSVRALNCLKAAEVSTLGQLVTFAKNDLLKFRNFGKKSLTEIEDLIKTKGLSFGMAIDKYRLDKE
ncbi:MAG TPA: DNA-directed RNA polymerase subunit alpha [Bacteroidia bacterium]|jgi:DNA-directed RNA polymerase subunit alpha|nr:DNA-directed RNA polymerase subunit alpha [Bacteroidia bacterium]